MSQEEKTVETALVGNKDSDRAGKYLTFQLDNTQFGIQILRVVELLTMMEITTVPMWPSFAKGTINLRGRVIPVVDLRQKFGLSATETTEQTCTIVVELEGDQVGIEVEAVNEVQEVSEDNISDPPRIGGTVDSDFILGMGKADDNTIILLNLEKILVGGDMEALQEVVGELAQPV
ncbi:MAG: chemotaxis protein CheW [Gemmatimonadales bacterium]|nr:chemotaxis protein CheW [Gemmatimonadales bacterium]